MSIEQQEKRRGMRDRFLRHVHGFARRDSTTIWSQEDYLAVFRPIAAKAPGFVHGDFLTCFAQAVVRADWENFELLRDAALALILKYDLRPEPLEDLPRKNGPSRPGQENAKPE